MNTDINILGPGELTLPELAVIANRECRLAEEHLRSALEHAIATGHALIAAKAQLRHGEWLPWLKTNFERSARHAENLMSLAANPQRVSHLPPETSLRKALEAVSSSGERAEPSDEEQPTAPTAETVALADLTIHKRSTRQDPPDLVEHIAAQLEATGYHDEVVVARDGTILAGESVVEAAALLGLEKIDVRRVDIEPDSAEALGIMALHYAAGKRAMVDDRAHAEMLKGIYAERGELDGTGYDPEMVANLMMISTTTAEIADANEAMEWMGVADYERVEQRANLVINFDTEEDRDAYFECLGVKWVKPRVTSMRWPAIGTIEFALRPALDDGFDA